MNSYLVSILIPLYNSEKYISETIDSCLNQIYENIEIIIVDDGSTDNSLTIVKEYEKRYKNIKVYTQKNSGAQKARNLAFEKSKGLYIQYLDADDLLSQDKISTQIALAKEHGNMNVYTTKFIRFEENIDEVQYIRREIDRSFDSGIDWLVSSWSGSGMGQTSIWLTPRELIERAGSWDESLSKNQDGEFFCRVLINTDKVIYSDSAIVYYRSSGDGSISKQMTLKAARATLTTYKLYEKHTVMIRSSELQKAMAYNYLSFINHFYPKFPALINEAEKRIKVLGHNYSTLRLPGTLYHMSKWIGFKNALRLREIVKLIKIQKGRDVS